MYPWLFCYGHEEKIIKLLKNNWLYSTFICLEYKCIANDLITEI